VVLDDTDVEVASSAAVWGALFGGINSHLKEIQNVWSATMKLTSFEVDIRPLFTERDIRAMSKAFNLTSYDDVKKHAVAIYDRIRGVGGAVMPPPPPPGEGPWPQSRIELFAKWMSEGFQP
jgi:hypothetical protein